MIQKSMLKRGKIINGTINTSLKVIYTFFLTKMQKKRVFIHC